MEQREFGRTGMRVSVIGFGGSEIGGEVVPSETVTTLLNGALDAGVNVIDTGECYGNSEALIGQALGQRRSDYYLFTKCGHASGLDLPDWDPRMLEQSIDRSLQRLRTDYIDLLQLHSCSEEVLRQGDVITVLQNARAAGKTRYIGYSGDREAARYAVECGAFDALQTSINIADQNAIERTLGGAYARGMGVIAKRPIANAAWRSGSRPENSYHHAYWERLQQLHYPFLNDDLSTAIGIALRFTLSTIGVSTAIVGTTNLAHLRQNIEQIAAGRLPQDEYQAIRERWATVAGPDWTGRG